MLKRIIVSTLLILLTLTPAAYAGQPAGSTDQNLTLDVNQAVNMALKNSTALKTADYNVERANEVQEAADLKVIYIPTSPSNSPTADAYYTGAVSASISARMAVKTKTVEEDRVVLTAVRDYNSLLNAIADQEYAKQNVATTLMQYNNNRISYDLGIVSSSQLIGYQASYQAAKAGLDRANLALDKAYLTFNSLLGLPIASRPVLSEKPAYSALKLASADAKISGILDQCPTVWLAEQSAKLANLQASLWNAASNTPYEAQIIDTKKAELTASDTRTQMRDLINGLYNGIEQSEAAYDIYSQQVKAQTETVRVKRIMFDLGMATKYDVMSAELLLADYQRTLNSTINNHEYLEMAFEKPWAYVASASN